VNDATPSPDREARIERRQQAVEHAAAMYVATRVSTAIAVLVVGLGLSTAGNIATRPAIFYTGIGIECIAAAMAGWTAWRAYKYQLELQEKIENGERLPGTDNRGDDWLGE
jgi:hypothetical protein